MNFRRMLADLRARLSPHARDPTATKPVVARDASDASTDSAGSSSSTDSSPRAATATDAEFPVDDDVKGLEQSPIDICVLDGDLVRQDDDAVVITVGSARARVVQTGGNFRVEWQGEHTNALTIKGKTYYAIQFHFHAPSEHTLGGQHEAMELHLVHQASDGSLAVVALFFREGRENEFLSQFFGELPVCEDDGAAVELECEVDPRCLQLLSGLFYRYRGSLTTPPYSEGVEWVVLQDVAEASAQQIAHYRSTIPCENARAVQPRNHRLVTLHRPCACSV
ncbi:hypothetical protein PybrP1_004000 [[Pythium] brassicae (nom. inval.)]|nr:hypothetical protein PybrP1_004000 [[Pythium] brassicae (nom. inval.)]